MFKQIVLGIHSRIDRSERERRKQKKLNRETTFQEVRVETRKAAARLARTKALADMPLPTWKKPKQLKPKGPKRK
jgi:hypothetical protein